MIVDNTNAMSSLMYDMNYQAGKVTRSFEPIDTIDNFKTPKVSEIHNASNVSGTSNVSDASEVAESLVKMKEDAVLYEANAKAVKVQNETLGKIMDIEV